VETSTIRPSPLPGVAGGTLLGPEGAARVAGSSVPGPDPGATPSIREGRAGGPCSWCGVRWGVCELDSGCEHLVVLDCCSVVFFEFLGLHPSVCKCFRAHGGCLGTRSR
jgi:hypothetical protein